MALADVIRKHALKNAFDYGKANPGAIAGKVIAEFPDAKSDMKATMKLVSAEAAKVNAMRKPDMEKELKNYTFAEKKVEEKRLVLPNGDEGKVVTRFPPEPSGYPHIGHAKAAFLDFEAAKAYGGRMVLRFDDTNPEKEGAEYVDAIKEGLEWLGISWGGKESYTSDSMPLIYDYAEKAIARGAAYVCTCTQEEISANREKQKPCACRNLGKEETLARWKMMHSGFGENGAIVRLRGDLSSRNTAMRDPTLFRILDAPHYRQGTKYRVWPTYDFAAPVMDSAEGITHAMRSKEYELRDEVYFRVIDVLGLRRPELVSFSRLAIRKAPVSKRFIAPLVKEGKVSGWDDPRLPTLKGLARRGILPEAIRDFVLSFGLSKVESEPGWDKLLSENRKLLEPKARHYFFVPNPVKIAMRNANPQVAELRMHPGSGMGTRKIRVGDSVYIANDDFEKIKEGETFRLKDLCNVKMASKAKKEIELVGEGMPEKKIQWVSEDFVHAEVMKPGDLLNEDGSFNEKSMEKISGYAENGVQELKEGETIQFERFGFCRLDKKGKKPVFVYSC